MTNRDRPRLNITLDAEVKDRLKDIASSLDVTSSRLIEEVLREFLDSFEEDPMTGRRLKKCIEDRKRNATDEDDKSQAVKNILEQMDNIDELQG